jgi:hypothetical protein
MSWIRRVITARSIASTRNVVCREQAKRALQMHWEAAARQHPSGGHSARRHRGPSRKRGAAPSSNLGKLPIEGLIARIAVEAHRHPFTVITRGDCFDVGAVIRRWCGAVWIVAR